MKKVRVRLGRRSYDILIGPGILPGLGQWLRRRHFSGRLVIITSPRVKGLYGDTLVAGFERDGFTLTTLIVPDGEEHKSLETAGRLYRELADCGAERTTPVVALGGGVIGDLAGFVAATYQRGVPLIQAPTTLLAQVDSAIGGKTAVDLGALKNQVGAFYQPRLVVCDTAILLSLPPEEVSNGLAEVIKYAVVQDRRFFYYLERHIDGIAGPGTALGEAVFRSARAKAQIVSRDERDTGRRNILNFGHTVGHAIEAASDLRVKHGEAVAIGMVAAARISGKLGFLGKDERLRIEALIQKAHLPVQMPGTGADNIVRAMAHDKKVVNGHVRFVLARAIGRVFITERVPESLVREVLAGGE